MFSSLLQQINKPNEHMEKEYAWKNIQMTGKTVLITGGSSGIGLETGIDLAKRGAKVILACRNFEKAFAAKRKIIGEYGNAIVEVRKLELRSLDSVRKLAESIIRTESRLDVLINNAGVMEFERSETFDGFEAHFGVNYLGHFLLTTSLLTLLKKSAPSRILTISSETHKLARINWNDLNDKKKYVCYMAYGQSKLFVILFSKYLGRVLAETGVTTYTINPGVVDTDLCRRAVFGKSAAESVAHLLFQIKWLLKTAKQGAQTSIYCSVAPELDCVSGKYYSNCQEEKVSRFAENEEAERRLWAFSVELVSRWAFTKIDVKL